MFSLEESLERYNGQRLNVRDLFALMHGIRLEARGRLDPTIRVQDLLEDAIQKGWITRDSTNFSFYNVTVGTTRERAEYASMG